MCNSLLDSISLLMKNIFDDSTVANYYAAAKTTTIFCIVNGALKEYYYEVLTVAMATVFN